MTERAIFASVKDALVFAFNHEDLSIPGPVMNREMAQIPTQAAPGSSKTTEGRPSPQAPKHLPLGGTQDRSVVAGWILQKVAVLSEINQYILAATLIKPKRPCSCGAQCCRGWVVKREWVAATRGLVLYLKDQADLSRSPGKRGYSTDPRLRVAIVEDWCRPETQRKSLADLADLAEVTTTTAAKHKTIIFEHLAEISDLAWTEIGHLLDAAGITGPIDA